jgi:hypothetical protein
LFLPDGRLLGLSVEGVIESWSATAPGSWSLDGGPDAAVFVAPTVDGTFSADGRRVLLADGGYNVFESVSGIHLSGELVAFE